MILSTIANIICHLERSERSKPIKRINHDSNGHLFIRLRSFGAVRLRTTFRKRDIGKKR